MPASWVNDGYHPIWSCIRLLLLLILLFVVLGFTASSFDETEMKAIGLIALGMGAGELIIPRWKKSDP